MQWRVIRSCPGRRVALRRDEVLSRRVPPHSPNLFAGDFLGRPTARTIQGGNKIFRRSVVGPSAKGPRRRNVYENRRFRVGLRDGRAQYTRGCYWGREFAFGQSSRQSLGRVEPEKNYCTARRFGRRLDTSGGTFFTGPGYRGRNLDGLKSPGKNHAPCTLAKATAAAARTRRRTRARARSHPLRPHETLSSPPHRRPRETCPPPTRPPVYPRENR